MSEWQLIETAPKDGTRVDLWVQDHRMPNCEWVNRAWRCYNGYQSPTTIRTKDVTHWIPLPEPPEQVAP